MKKMTLLILSLFALTTFTLTNPAMAAGQGQGQGHGQGHGNQGIGNVSPGKPAKFEKFDKAGIKDVSNVPPGLRDKGLPPGLSKQNKTPSGWDKGDKNVDDENAFRRGWNRFIDIFR